MLGSSQIEESQKPSLGPSDKVLHMLLNALFLHTLRIILSYTRNMFLCESRHSRSRALVVFDWLVINLVMYELNN